MELQKTLEDLKKKSFSVEIFGLGYVGFPLAVRLASAGLNVVGIDTNSDRIDRLKKNNLLDSELHLKDEFFQIQKNNKIKLVDVPEKSELPKIGIICVPTPIPDKNTSSDIYVKAAVENFLNFSSKGDVIILESSIEVGTTEKIAKIIEVNGFSIGKNYGLCFCPERIDPSNKEWGLENIPRVIYCSDDITFDVAKMIYQSVNQANLIRVSSPNIAEVVKSFENAFRLVNISLVNELAVLCDNLGINVREVIDAASTKPFGFLPHYSGAGAGGHCIPKDPRFLVESAKNNNSNFDIIENALKINSQIPVYIVNSIDKNIELMKLEKSVLLCGLSYKANVEDMRDSPSFKIANEMKKRNFKIFGYDPFFKNELKNKYLIENNLNELNFEIIEELNENVLKKISCICIVQHHELVKDQINAIYDQSQVPLIYDCQNKLENNSKSTTILDGLGK